MDQTTVLLTILGMSLVTYAPRLLPLWALPSRSLPRLAIAWLRYVPVAVLAAMLSQSLLVRDGELDLALDNLYLWAALPCFLIAWKKQSLFGAVIAGMVVIALARVVLGS